MGFFLNKSQHKLFFCLFV